jgi:hypothetical protein
MRPISGWTTPGRGAMDRFGKQASTDADIVKSMCDDPRREMVKNCQTPVMSLPSSQDWGTWQGADSTQGVLPNGSAAPLRRIRLMFECQKTFVPITKRGPAPQKEQDNMRARRNANRKRAGRLVRRRALPLEFVKQGSSAMKPGVGNPATTTTSMSGVSQEGGSRRRSRGRMSSLQARQMVRDALD